MRWALARLRSVWVTLTYGVVLICIGTALTALGPAAQTRVIADASTNLHNLSRGHVGTLLVSAVVVDAGPMTVWLPGLLCLLGLVELLWGHWRLVVAFLVGHVGATVLVAVGLTAAVTWRWMSPEVTRVADVGMSYGAAAAMGSFTAAIPRRWRPPWIGWWIGVGAAVIVVGRDFTDVGHAVALVLGALVASRFGAPAPWTPVRAALLLVATSFGFLVIANTPQELVAACVAGPGGVVLTELARLAFRRVRGRSRQRNSSADASTQSESHDSGGHSSNSPGMSHS